MGYQFLYNAGNDANAIIQTARIMPMLLTILTLILVYFLAKRLMGSWWALFPAFLFGLSPTILAHGHYVTTDVGAAFGILLATISSHASSNRRTQKISGSRESRSASPS